MALRNFQMGGLQPSMPMQGAQPQWASLLTNMMGRTTPTMQTPGGGTPYGPRQNLGLTNTLFNATGAGTPKLPQLPMNQPQQPQGALGPNTNQLQFGGLPIDQVIKRISLGLGAPPEWGNQRASLLGGNQYDPNYLTPSGPVENQLFNMFQGGVGNFGTPLNPLVNSLAGGQLPPGIQAQLDQNLARQRAQLLEQYGRAGSLYGSDAASYITREQGRTINDAMAQAEQRALEANQLQQSSFQNALGRYLGVGGGLLGQETTRNMTAQQMLWQEYMQQQGIPPEIAALLTAGGLTGTAGSGTTVGPQPVSTLGSSIAGGTTGVLTQLLPLILSSVKGAY